MQGPVKRGVALTYRDLSRYESVDKGWNKLEEKGIAYLSKAEWGKLKKIALGRKIET